MPDFSMTLKARIIRKLATPLMLVALAHPASAFQITRVGTESGVFLRLRGDVRVGDYSRLKSILQNGTFVGLEIRSGGGSLEDGLDIARVVRDQGLVVYALKECDSVCAFIFFAAKERYMGRGCKIGVHSVSNNRGKEDADSARATVQMSRLLVGLGVPHSIIGKIVATPPAKITFLTNRDLAALNVRQTNPFRRNDGTANATQSQGVRSVSTPGIEVEPERRPGRTEVLHDSSDARGEIEARSNRSEPNSTPFPIPHPAAAGKTRATSADR
jgi:hypothetical protein